MNPNDNGVDIIIPVYNAYEDLVLCLKSIFRYTNLEKNRVIIINDKSSDERIAPYLDGIKMENVIVLHNEVNQGFSSNVNKGMAYSKRDVILLNSDTIVTKKWVEKIVRCAYLRDEIGTVTPLSNSATIASVPVAFQDNKVPENVTIDEFAELIEGCSFHEYPRITVAVGFCMFIKQEVIELVGEFDAKTYERGYGEENDFCNRAEQYGYIHVLCDDTFVYHKGTVSFLSEEKKKLIEAHDKILYERFEKQMQYNAKFCAKNPQQYIRDNINLHLKWENGRKNILYVIHSDFREDAHDHVGGTQFHVKDLTEGLKEENNIFVLTRDKEYLRLTAYIGEERISFRFMIGEQSAFQEYHNTKLAKLMTMIINACSIDLIHVHHISSLSLDVFHLANKLHIPLLCTLHDYFYICPTIKLVDGNGIFCGGNCLAEKSKVCLKKRCKIASETCYLMQWRKQNGEALGLCDQLIAPSESCKLIYEDVYPFLKGKIKVIEHGLDIIEEVPVLLEKEPETSTDVKGAYENICNKNTGMNMITGWCFLENINNTEAKIYLDLMDESGAVWRVLTEKRQRLDVDMNFNGQGRYLETGFEARISNRDQKGITKCRMVISYRRKEYTNQEWQEIHSPIIKKENKFHIAFLGGMVQEKGSEIAYHLITSDLPNVNWFILGNIDGRDPLADLEQNNLYKIGQYERSEVLKLLKQYQIDLICILPIWAETFCYTLSEAIMGKVPVLVTDIGAVSERVKRLNCGYVVPVNATPKEISATLEEIIADKHTYLEKCESIEKISNISVENMLCQYREVYASYTNEFIIRESYPGNKFYEGLLQENESDPGTIDGKLYQELEQLRNENEVIKQATIYRIMLKIANMKLPFIATIRKIIHKLVN